MVNEKVILVGLRETTAGLKEFDKSALRKFNKVINKELRIMKQEAIKIATEASTHGEYQNAPLSGWQTTQKVNQPLRKGQKRPFPIWDTAEVLSNISTSKREGKVRKDYTTSAGALINASAAGRIFELAGSGKGSRNPGARSESFKKNLTNRFGKTGRLVFRALDNNSREYLKNISEALEQAKRDLQTAMEKQSTK